MGHHFYRHSGVQHCRRPLRRPILPRFRRGNLLCEPLTCPGAFSYTNMSASLVVSTISAAGILDKNLVSERHISTPVLYFPVPSPGSSRQVSRATWMATWVCELGAGCSSLKASLQSLLLLPHSLSCPTSRGRRAGCLKRRLLWLLGGLKRILDRMTGPTARSRRYGGVSSLPLRMSRPGFW